MQLARSASMRVRIGVALLVGAVVPLLVLAGLVYWFEGGQVRDQALDTLDAVADVQRARAASFELSALRTVRLLAGSTELQTELRALADGVEPDLLVVEDALREARAASGVIAATVTDLDGVVVATTRQMGTGEVVPLVTRLDLADTTSIATAVLGPQAGRDDGDRIAERPPRLVLAAPLTLGGRPVGAVVVELRLDPLLDLTTDLAGLGETGETLLGIRTQGGDALFITPLRFDPDAAFRREIAASTPGIPINVALEGRETLLPDAVDYRGEQVLAATRLLPTTGIGLVVKVDRDEAFASVRTLWRLVLSGVVVAAALAAVLAVLIGRRLARPIADLQQVAERIGRGDAHATADTSAPGELGSLAATLNEMGVEVAAARDHLEQQVEERTRDLEEQLREVEHRNEELDAFSSAVAHDLKSPLAVIKGALDTVRDGRADPEQTEQLLIASAGAADRMRHLIDDLLSLARTGVVELASQQVDLQRLTTEVSEHLEIRDIVEVTPMPTMTGDSAMLRQALQNLLANAAAYAGADGDPHVRVSVVDVDDRHVAIAVDDDGSGIAPAERDAVFRPFTRGASSQGTSGTGVGLAIVARIAERHDGRAVAADSPLGGARMLLVVPRHRVGATHPDPAPTPV